MSHYANLLKSHSISDGSVKLYAERLDALYKKCNDREFKSLLEECFKLDDGNTKMASLSALFHLSMEVACDSEDISKMKQDYQRLKAVLKSKKKERKVVPTESDWQKLQDINKELTKQLKADPTNDILVQKQLLWYLYCLMLPRRSQEWRTMMLKGEGDNYYDKDKKQFIIKSHKTSRSECGCIISYSKSGKKVGVSYGKQDYLIINPPSKVIELINKLMSINEDREYLFEVNGKPMSSVQYNRFQNSVLGVSTNKLRHIMASRATSQLSDQTKQAIITAEAMGHKVETQQGVYQGYEE